MKFRVMKIRREVEKTIFYDNCFRCDKEITGYSEKQVNQRINVHLLGCVEDDDSIENVEKEEQKVNGI